MACRITPPEERFWAKVKKTKGCWIWTGCLNTDGYGQFFPGNKKAAIGAHRFSWELHKAPIPEGLEVLHKCDTPACVRPSHLFLGTQADNIVDMYKKGRQTILRGEAHGNSKLTTEIVTAIINHMRQPKHDARAIAKKYGIGRGTIYFIMQGRAWKHLQGDRTIGK